MINQLESRVTQVLRRGFMLTLPDVRRCWMSPRLCGSYARRDGCGRVLVLPNGSAASPPGSIRPCAGRRGEPHAAAGGSHRCRRMNRIRAIACLRGLPIDVDRFSRGRHPTGVGDRAPG